MIAALYADLAGVRSRTALRKRIDQTLNGSICAESRQRQCTQDIENVEDTHSQFLGFLREETTDDTPHALIVADGLSSRGVETLPVSQGGALYPVRQSEKRREAIGELQNTHGGDYRGQPGEVGDTGGENKRDTPVDGNQDDPEQLAAPGGQRWTPEELDQDLVVQD